MANAPRTKAMDRTLDELTSSTADAAFVVDSRRRVVAWNRAAAQLLGYEGRQVLGKRCHEILRGTDLYGNPFCQECCPLVRAVLRREPLHRFAANLRSASGRNVCVRVVALLLPHGASGERDILHVLAPCICPEQAVAIEEQNEAPGNGPDRGDLLDLLSPREVEVLKLIGDGKSTGEIASLLCISAVTVRNHAQRIMRKLDVHCRLAAVSAARRSGML
jgi:PAS domain S-box-containing protein